MNKNCCLVIINIATVQNFEVVTGKFNMDRT